MWRRLLFVFASLVSSVACFKMDGLVMMFSSLESFQSALNDFDSMLVEFCDPSLEICQSSRIQFNVAATILSTREPHIGFARINYSGGEEIHSFYNIRKLPTVIMFRANKKKKVFDSHLVGDVIAAWASKVANPKCRYLDSKEDVEKFIQKYPATVISYDMSPDNSNQLRDLSSTFTNVYFGEVVDPLVANEVGEDFPSLVIRKDYDEGRHVHLGKMNREDMQSWIELYTQPLVAKATKENLGSLFINKNVDTVYIYLNNDQENEEGEHGRILNDLREVAKDFRGRTVFAYIPESIARTLMVKLRIVKEDLPSVVLYRVAAEMSNTFRLFDKITQTSVRNQLESFFNGTLQPTIRSLPIPEKNPGPVVELVGLNFNEIVLDDFFDVLVLFYSPYCERGDPCEEFFETVKALGEYYRDSQTIKITQIDLTQNDIDVHVAIQSLPTFVLFPAKHKNKRLVYHGSPDFKSVQRFVYENYVLETPPPRPTQQLPTPEHTLPHDGATHAHIHSEL